MTDDAPTVIAEVRGFSFRDPLQQAHYIRLMPGEPLMIEREPHNPSDANAVRVITCCSCESFIGRIDRRSAATLSLWMDRGVHYMVSVKSPALILRPLRLSSWLVVRCVPIKAVKVSTKIEETENV